MDKDYRAFTWSDNWQIDGDKAWFVSGMHNILICLNLKTNECEFAVCIPEDAISKFRLTPYCLKCRNDVFCMPVAGRFIWIYDIEKGKFSKIVLDKSNKVNLRMRDFWEYDNKLFIVSDGLCQIIEIDIIKKKVENHYVLGKNRNIVKSIKVGTNIYSLSGLSDEVYQFDMVTKKIVTHKLPNIGRKFNTFCFDGEQFWLSGYCKEIYVWNKEKNIIKIVDGFPKEFGIYNFSKNTNGEIDCTIDEFETPAFLYSAAVGENVWFIPFQTNQIIYVDKENFKLSVFEADNEYETKQSLLERNVFNAKYIFEYIRENRYIGLFSVKNNYILEIDTQVKENEIKKYTFSDKCINEIIEIWREDIFYENNGLSREVFRTILSKLESKGKNEMTSDIGLTIYEEMLKL